MIPLFNYFFSSPQQNEFSKTIIVALLYPNEKEPIMKTVECDNIEQIIAETFQVDKVSFKDVDTTRIWYVHDKTFPQQQINGETICGPVAVHRNYDGEFRDVTIETIDFVRKEPEPLREPRRSARLRGKRKNYNEE